MPKHNIILEIIKLQREIIVFQKDLGINKQLMPIKNQKELRGVCVSKTFTLLPEFLHSLGIKNFLTLPYHHSDIQNTVIEWVNTPGQKISFHYQQEKIYKILDKTPNIQLEEIKSEYIRYINIIKNSEN